MRSHSSLHAESGILRRSPAHSGLRPSRMSRTRCSSTFRSRASCRLLSGALRASISARMSAMIRDVVRRSGLPRSLHTSLGRAIVLARVALQSCSGILLRACALDIASMPAICGWFSVGIWFRINLTRPHCHRALALGEAVNANGVNDMGRLVVGFPRRPGALRNAAQLSCLCLRETSA